MYECGPYFSLFRESSHLEQSMPGLAVRVSVSILLVWAPGPPAHVMRREIESGDLRPAANNKLCKIGTSQID